MADLRLENRFSPFILLEQSSTRLVLRERGVRFQQLFYGFIPFALLFALIVGMQFALEFLLVCAVVAFVIPLAVKRVLHTYTFEPGSITIYRHGLFKNGVLKSMGSPDLVGVRPHPFISRHWFASVDAVFQNGQAETILSCGGLIEETAKLRSQFMADAISAAIKIGHQ